ncbi:hypothetical protein IHE44_0001070, partial [Lamprotornis superbus]
AALSALKQFSEQGLDPVEGAMKVENGSHEKYQQHHKDLCVELIKILHLNSVILVSLRHSKVPVPVKRFQSVPPAAFIFSKNILQYSHTDIEMLFGLPLSLATSKNLSKILASVMLQQPLDLSPIFSLADNTFFKWITALSTAQHSLAVSVLTLTHVALVSKGTDVLLLTNTKHSTIEAIELQNR